MYENEKFENVGLVPSGEIVIKMPGTDIVFPYSSGKAFVNESGSIGYLELKVEDYLARKSGESETGKYGERGKKLRKKLGNRMYRPFILAMAKQNPMNIFYSMAEDKNILTVPGSGDKNRIDPDNYSDFILTMYGMGQGAQPEVAIAGNSHIWACMPHKLIVDRDRMLQEVTSLADKTNDAYLLALGLMKQVK